jgi:hypothetical protein
MDASLIRYARAMLAPSFPDMAPAYGFFIWLNTNMADYRSSASAAYGTEFSGSGCCAPRWGTSFQCDAASLLRYAGQWPYCSIDASQLDGGSATRTATCGNCCSARELPTGGSSWRRTPPCSLRIPAYEDSVKHCDEGSSIDFRMRFSGSCRACKCSPRRSDPFPTGSSIGFRMRFSGGFIETSMTADETPPDYPHVRAPDDLALAIGQFTQVMLLVPSLKLTVSLIVSDGV